MRLLVTDLDRVMVCDRPAQPQPHLKLARDI